MPLGDWVQVHGFQALHGPVEVQWPWDVPPVPTEQEAAEQQAEKEAAAVKLAARSAIPRG